MTVCLNMIVKNESRVIRRCLDSVKHLVDHWVIVDTGSTDGTQDVIREALADVPGELHERPWVDFGHNRSEALELARDTADYSLMIDADEVLEGLEERPKLGLDAYSTERQWGYRTQFVRNALPWKFVGAVHEVVVCDAPFVEERLNGVVCRSFSDGARNADPKAKFESDAKMLEAALRKDSTHARSVFYLAQSYRDAGNLELASRTYKKRVEMGGWAEEVWYSLFQIAVINERRGKFSVESYLKAFQYRPSRAEPLHELARHFREVDQHATAYLFASRAATIPRPSDVLFVYHEVYAWRMLDELSIAAFYTGRVEEALVASDRLLSESRFPEKERARLESNREFSTNTHKTSSLGGIHGM